MDSLLASAQKMSCTCLSACVRVFVRLSACSTFVCICLVTSAFAVVLHPMFVFFCSDNLRNAGGAQIFPEDKVPAFLVIISYDLVANLCLSLRLEPCCLDAVLHVGN
uniref:Uncharacterized protein n=1 Tax=Oryza meridionalis TaxID=40149 RepID=A0A0E0EQK8_9ORYZ